jgi:transglutaminase-like putative cysteine protease
MFFEIVHTTEYHYEDSISLCHNTARLSPRSTRNQVCKKTNFRISPHPDVMSEYTDFFGNKVLYFAIQQEHRNLTVTVSSLVSCDESGSAAERPGREGWEEVRDKLKASVPEFLDAKQFVLETPMTIASREIVEYGAQSFEPGRPYFESVCDLIERIHQDFEFKTGFTTIATPLGTVMEQRKGVCQDFAHLSIACLRALGLPARYVSGYIETIPPPGREKLMGIDASHAWFSAYFPGSGWIDFDPTNHMIPSDQHITIGWGRDYADVTPLKGIVLSSGNHALTVSVNVRRV